MEGDVITLQDIFLFDFGMGVDEHGKFRGHLKATGTRPKFAEKLAGPGHPPRPRGLPARGLRPARERCPMTRPRSGGRRFAALVAACCCVFVVGPGRVRAGRRRRPAASSSARSTAPTRTKVDVTFVYNGDRGRPRAADRPRGRPARHDRPAVPLARAGIKRLARHRARQLRVDGRRRRSASRQGGPRPSWSPSLGDDEPVGARHLRLRRRASRRSSTTDHAAVRRAIDERRARRRRRARCSTACTKAPSLVEASRHGAAEHRARHRRLRRHLDHHPIAGPSATCRASSANLFAVAYGAPSTPTTPGCSASWSSGPAAQSRRRRPARTLAAGLRHGRRPTLDQPVRRDLRVDRRAGRDAASSSPSPASRRRSRSCPARSPGAARRSTPPRSAAPGCPDFLSTGTGKVLGVGAMFLAVALGVFAIASLMTKNESVLDNVLSPTPTGWTPRRRRGRGWLRPDRARPAGRRDHRGLRRAPGLPRARSRSELEQADLPAAGGRGDLLLRRRRWSCVGVMLLVLNGPLRRPARHGRRWPCIPPAILNFLAKRRQKQFDGAAARHAPAPVRLAPGRLLAHAGRRGRVPGGRRADGQGAAPGRAPRPASAASSRSRSTASAARMDSADFEWAVMAIRIQREVGGNLAELLMTVGETMIDRERLRREVAALTAEGKISAIVLGILPLGHRRRHVRRQPRVHAGAVHRDPRQHHAGRRRR